MGRGEQGSAPSPARAGLWRCHEDSSGGGTALAMSKAKARVKLLIESPCCGVGVLTWFSSVAKFSFNELERHVASHKMK